MDIEEIAIYSIKIIGFILVASGIGSMVWSGWAVNITHLLMITLGILFSGGGFLFGGHEGPSEEELREMHEREIAEMYVPPTYREFDRKKAGYEAAHRLRELTQNTGNWSDRKGP